MINQSFLESLEYSISRALANSPNKKERVYWCDGVIVDNLDKEQELKLQVLKTQSLKAVAVIPKGQYEEATYRFDMNLIFGKEAMNRLKNEQDLENAIYEPSDQGWIMLDLSTKSITVQLK